MNLRDVIRDYPDYPKKGIIFKDMWPAIENPDAFEQILTEFEKEFKGKIDTVIGIESRGFIFGAALANIAFEYKIKRIRGFPADKDSSIAIERCRSSKFFG